LNSNYVAGYDFISNTTYAGDGNLRDSDPSDPGDYFTDADGFHASSWHGTHVSGIIGATANGTGALGVSPLVSIMPLRALGRSGGLLSDINDAITWGSGGTVNGISATPTKRANILSMSLGGSGSTCPTSTQNAINGAVARGTIIVVAAGNDGIDIANSYPANCNNVITVMATDSNGERTSWSNFGSVASATNSIYVYAPGASIYSTWNTGITVPGSETYASMSGTSMATPLVSGVIALILAVKPTATFSEIKSLLVDTNNTTLTPSGIRVINAGNLVLAANGTPVIQSAPVITPAPAPVVEAAVPVVEAAPIVDPVIAPAPLTFAAKKKFSGKNFAAQSGVEVPAKSTVTLKVKSGKKFCAIKSGKLATLKAGTCSVAVKVKTKVKVGKKYKYTSKTTTVSLVVA
jgi:serine protease